LDPSLKEFWSTNPWDIVTGGHNLSAFERDRMWFNIRGKHFLDVSYLSGTDNDGDGRGVVAADFRNCGQMDLIVRHVSGGPVLLYENKMPRKHYLTVSLRGTKSNKRGIGARLVAKANGQQIVRELYANNSFMGQAPPQVHFGLAEATKLDELSVLWPSGETQLFTNITADRHIVITEGKDGNDAIETVIPAPGKIIEP
jgi:hypothetical protein